MSLCQSQVKPHVNRAIALTIVTLPPILFTIPPLELVTHEGFHWLIDSYIWLQSVSTAFRDYIADSECGYILSSNLKHGYVT